MKLTQQDQVELRIIELNQEHQDLHYIIDHLSEEIQPDELRIRRLKKRRLLIKDQLEHLKSNLIPDIDA